MATAASSTLLVVAVMLLHRGSLLGVAGQKVACLKSTYGRGAGVIPSSCPDDHPNLENGLCYANCPDGYVGNAFRCYKPCPDGFQDTPFTCTKPGSYGRGAGYCWLFNDPKANCENDHGADNCEIWGTCWYPKCSADFYAVGCCVCSPQCPAGYSDFGVGCSKPAADRGVGILPICSSDQNSQAGLCYNQCNSGYNGVGPVCWAASCPPSYPDECGAFCAASGTCPSINARLGSQAGAIAGTAAAVVGCAVSTFATFGAASACWGGAVAAVVGSEELARSFWQDSVAGYC